MRSYGDGTPEYIDPDVDPGGGCCEGYFSSDDILWLEENVRGDKPFVRKRRGQSGYCCFCCRPGCFDEWEPLVVIPGEPIEGSTTASERGWKANPRDKPRGYTPVTREYGITRAKPTYRRQDGTEQQWGCAQANDAGCCMPYKYRYCSMAHVCCNHSEPRSEQDGGRYWVFEPLKTSSPNEEGCNCNHPHHGCLFISDMSPIRLCDETGYAISKCPGCCLCAPCWRNCICPGSWPAICWLPILGCIEPFECALAYSCFAAWFAGCCWYACHSWCRARYRKGDVGEFYETCVDPFQPPRRTAETRKAHYYAVRLEKARIKAKREAESLRNLMAIYTNDEGNSVSRATGSDDVDDHVRYCGKNKDDAGSDGRCGPDGGPACASCVRWKIAYDILYPLPAEATPVVTNPLYDGSSIDAQPTRSEAAFSPGQWVRLLADDSATFMKAMFPYKITTAPDSDGDMWIDLRDPDKPNGTTVNKSKVILTDSTPDDDGPVTPGKYVTLNEFEEDVYMKPRLAYFVRLNESGSDNCYLTKAADANSNDAKPFLAPVSKLRAAFPSKGSWATVRPGEDSLHLEPGKCYYVLDGPDHNGDVRVDMDLEYPDDMDKSRFCHVSKLKLAFELKCLVKFAPGVKPPEEYFLETLPDFEDGGKDIMTVLKPPEEHHSVMGADCCVGLAYKGREFSVCPDNLVDCTE